MPLFQTITSFFSGAQPNDNASSSSNNRRSAINSTFDAFSLPTTARYNSQGLGGHMNDPTDSVSSSPGPSRRDSYNLQASNSYHPSNGVHPPLSNTFHRLRKNLANTFPELLETLNPPADGTLLASFERELGCQLPDAVRESFRIADGQDLDSGCSGLFFGLHWMPLEDVMREWAFWRHAEHDPEAGKNPAVLATMASVPPAWIKQLYACRGWIPLITDRSGNYVGVDLDPGPGGQWGQVIVFGRDFDRKCVQWRGDGEGGWGKWLAGFVDDLESGDGWEADRSSSSDEEEEAGYSSYNGGAVYGETGKGLKLAGEYKGWGVLEAWWDKSVRRWEELGLGLDVDDIERGLAEARRLAGLKDRESPTENVGMRTGESSAQVEIPVLGSPHIPQAPPTPTPADSDVLLPPSSPDHPSSRTSRLRSKVPVRIITPLSNLSDHPLRTGGNVEKDIGNGLLSAPSHRRTKPAPPAPTSLDLPTRADVQATTAIAEAEASGLRGGWIMNIDTGNQSRKYRSGMGGVVNGDSEMVDIDLEGGQGERIGSPRPSREDMERAREEEKYMMAMGERRVSNQLIPTRTPSPLSREASFEIPDSTPRPTRGDSNPVPASVVAATNALRRPPPIASPVDGSKSRSGAADEDRDREVLRTRKPLSRGERESSVVSVDSQDGLLDARSIPSRSSSPTAFGEHGVVGLGYPVGDSTYHGILGSTVQSPTTITGNSLRDSQDNPRAPPMSRESSTPSIRLVNPDGYGVRGRADLSGLEGEMEDISLDTEHKPVP